MATRNRLTRALFDELTKDPGQTFWSGRDHCNYCEQAVLDLYRSAIDSTDNKSHIVKPSVLVVRYDELPLYCRLFNGSYNNTCNMARVSRVLSDSGYRHYFAGKYSSEAREIIHRMEHTASTPPRVIERIASILTPPIPNKN